MQKVELAYELSFKIKQSEKLYFIPQRLEFHKRRIIEEDGANREQNNNNQVEDYQYEFVSNESSSSNSEPINISSDSSENSFISQREDHLMTVHKFKCDICNKSFQYQQNLEIHIDMWHSELKVTPNNTGNVQLKSSNKYPEFKARRARNSSNRFEISKPFKCNFQGCSRAFAAFSLLNYHKVSHTGNLRFYQMIVFNNLFFPRSFCLLILWKNLQNYLSSFESSADKSHLEGNLIFIVFYSLNRTVNSKYPN